MLKNYSSRWPARTKCTNKFDAADVLRQQHNKISAVWTNDIDKDRRQTPEGFRIVKGRNGDALSIAPLAVTKAITETSILRAMNMATEELGKVTDEAAWKKIAQLHPTDAMLDDRSIFLIRTPEPDDHRRGSRTPDREVSGVDCARHRSQRVPDAHEALRVVNERSGSQ